MKALLFIPSLFINSLLYADTYIYRIHGLVIIHPEKGEFALKGTGESCKIIMKTKTNAIDTDCTYLVNSKNIDIICTPKKTMCKTITEVNAFVKKEKQPFLEDIKGYYYSKARKIIIEAGYTPIKSTTIPRDVHEKRIYDKGYIELSYCDTKGIDLFCKFEFHAKNGQRLVIDTYGNTPTVATFYYKFKGEK